jgi:5-methyltetrahydropteroyltriglutamate--homocysteine methyltransferase
MIDKEKNMSAINPPFRYDIVGSFLRKPELKQARSDYEAQTISADVLQATEDRCIADLVAQEKAAGLQAVTDGEYRRAYWHLDFLWDLLGVDKVEVEHFSIAFQGTQPKSQTLRITSKVDFPVHHPFLKHFRFLKKTAGDDVLAKQCIPSPSMLHLICCVREEHYKPIDRYKDEAVLLDDIAVCYQHAIKAFYDEGCRYLQLDDTSWGELCSQEKRAAYAARGIDVDELARKYVALINKVLEAKPDDMTITMHICRGNFRSTWFTSGGYEPVAQTLFGGCNVDGFFLEYDSDRAGGFEPLRFIKGQTVVLGLITSKTPQLEDKEAVIARIHEAAKYVPLDQLCLSPQCGFASTEEGNLLSEDEQWAKIALVRDIAQTVWQ